MAKRSTVPKRLERLAALFAERNKVYGTDYLHVGEVLCGLFPNGLELRTPVQFRKFYMFVYMLGKLNRYAQCLSRGEGHADSMSDLAVYAMMVQELDGEET
jgi:hypothetical protein